MPAQVVRILLVEDNPADVEMTRQGLLQSGAVCELHVVEHGGKAISFLHREGEYSDAPRPNLILLDVDLPQLDGFGVLKHIKSQATLRDIPVVVLSSLNEPEKVRETCKLRANAYLTKPVCFEQSLSLAKHLSDYWFGMVQLPLRDDLRRSERSPTALSERG
jgi:CheY-like chemotaxis protein